MKFTAAFAFALTALPSVLGAAIPELDKRLLGIGNTPIVGSIQRVEAGIKNVDAAVLKVNSSNLVQLLAVNTAASQLSTTLSTETAFVNKQKSADIVGALKIQAATSDLISAVQKLSKDIINIKPFVTEAGVQAIVLQTLQNQKTSADTYSNAITAKVPSLVSGIAELNKEQVDDALQAAINAYSS